MGMSIVLANQLNDLLFGQHAFTIPDPWTYTLHLCTHLVGAITAPNDTIAVNNPISEGVTLIVDPGTINAETRIVSNVAGSSPWIVTLDSDLVINHADLAYVAFDLGIDGENLLEPSGGSFADIDVDNDDTNFPSSIGGQETNGVTVTFAIPTALWGKASHLVIKDGSDVHLWGWLTSFPLLTTGMTGGPSFPVGNIRVLTNGGS